MARLTIVGSVIVLYCYGAASAQQTPEAITLDEVASGICARYARMHSLKVTFREEFTHYAQHQVDGPWHGTAVDAEGTWTVDLPDDTPLSRVREKLEVNFLKGAGAFVTSPGEAQGGSAVYTWDGKQARKLDRYVAENRSSQGSFGWIRDGKPPQRGHFEIQSFLFFWHRYEDTAALAKGLTNPDEPVQIVGRETVAGVPCVVLERKARRYNYRWRMAVAPDRDFVLMRFKAWSPRDAAKPTEWIEVEKLERFGDLWFPTAGEYVVKRPMSDRLWEHRFHITGVTRDEPIDDAVVQVAWPANTTVFDMVSDLQYRVMPDGSIPERTAALDRALAQAVATRPPPVSSGPGWPLILLVVLGVLAIGGVIWWLWRLRRSLAT